MLNNLKYFAAFGLVLTLTSCGGGYYDSMGKIGVHKHEILVYRVTAARDSQQLAKERFSSALKYIRKLNSFQGDKLRDEYQELKRVLNKCEDQANRIHDRVDAVDDVAEVLFAEWEAELNHYSSANLQKSSKNQLQQTQSQYYKLISAMRKAEAKLDPVLTPLRDQTLFLKNNLNSPALDSLQNEFTQVETDISRLIRDLELAIKEADGFILILKM